MADSLDIAEVTRLTGLTSRALRFYEARGLVTPLRTASGRRHYGPAELERLHQIMAMKRAGLTLAQIQKLSAGRRIDLRRLVEAQLKELKSRERELAQARVLLNSILSRIDRSEPIDVATFCSLIRQGEITMTYEKWDELATRYMTAEQREAVKQMRSALPEDLDIEAQMEKWEELTSRIRAALPLDPASPKAQAFLDELLALTEPFVAFVPLEMKEGTKSISENFEQWEGEMPASFVEIYRFKKAATAAREEMRKE